MIVRTQVVFWGCGLAYGVIDWTGSCSGAKLQPAVHLSRARYATIAGVVIANQLAVLLPCVWLAAPLWRARGLGTSALDEDMPSPVR